MRSRLHIVTVIISGVLAAGCAKIEQHADSIPQHVIGYEVVENRPASKAVFSTDETFMSAAYKLGSGQTWDAHKAYASQYFNALQEEVSYMDTYWKTVKDYYWPYDGGSLTFFSYAPSSLKDKGASISKEGVSITGWDVNTNKDKVILVADIAKDKTKNESYASFSGVPTLFRHKLSKVTFKVAKSEFAEDEIAVHIKTLKIADIYTSGSYSGGGYSNDSWSGLGSLKTESDPYLVYENTGTGELLSSDAVKELPSIIMIPQMLSMSGEIHPRIVVEYTTTTGSTVTEKSAECFFVENFRSGSWEKGQHYTYTIYIGVGQHPIEFTGSVSNWESADKGTVNVE